MPQQSRHNHDTRRDGSLTSAVRCSRRAFAAAVLVGSLAATAAGIEDHRVITDTVHDFVAQRAAAPGRGDVTVRVSPLDPRLRLAACGTALDTFMPDGARAAGNTTVGVRCVGPHPWLIYVPVTVQEFGAVLVAARPLARGERIGADDVRLERRDLSRIRGGYLASVGDAVGKVLTRPLAVGTALDQRAVEAPRLVQRGERVTILARAGGLEVRMTGTALADGAEGELIRVRNLATRRVVEGTVAGLGLVAVAL